jgi:hypothetical protein
MLLRICPRGAALVPYKHAAVGQQARYIGRSYDTASNSWPADKAPCVIDTEKARPELVLKVRKRAQSGDVMPFDAETAQELRVPYKLLEWAEGEWVEAKATPAKRESAGGKA